MSPLQKGQSHREEAKRAKIFKKLKKSSRFFTQTFQISKYLFAFFAVSPALQRTQYGASVAVKKVFAVESFMPRRSLTRLYQHEFSGYSLAKFQQDALAGLTVTAVAYLHL
jgi:hypothetical protein